MDMTPQTWPEWYDGRHINCLLYTSILALLIAHPKRVFTYELIMELVWNEDYSLYSRKAVNNHVSNLRRKLKVTQDSPGYIKSVVSVGYKFEVP